MKRVVFSLASSGLFTFLLIALSPVGGLVESITLRLAFISGYFPFAVKWFGVDCLNADSIQDKLSCALMMVMQSWLIYAVIFYLVSFLIWRPRRAELPVDHNVAGTTIGINN